ncbi:MAG: DUF1127 domain-containing protein [Comamonadaceae bacterium]|nr:MAG: DUF1127 domain-containing protein [Comamonadaceae bacterium]
MVFSIFLPFQAVAHALGRLIPSRKTGPECARRSREDLLQMSAHELRDLGIGRGDIPALMDDPQAWLRDRR